jgi:hypothetical protein
MKIFEIFVVTIFALSLAGVVQADSEIINQDYQISGDYVMGRSHTTTFEYELAVEYKPVDTSIVIDESGSMSGEMSDVKSAARGYVDSTRTSDGDENAVVSFASGASTRQSLTSSKSAAKSAINGISSGGGTDLPAGVSEGHDSLNSGSNPNQVMIVLADGGGGNPGSQADSARSDGINVHGIMYGSGASTSEFESLTNSQCSTSSSENNDGDNCWYAEPGTIDSVYSAIREETDSEREVDLHLKLPSHAESFSYNPDNVEGDGTKEYVFENRNTDSGVYTFDLPWNPKSHGSNLPMKLGESYVEFTEDGSTTNYFFDQAENSQVDYVDLNIVDKHAVRDVAEGEIDVSVTVKNEGNTESKPNLGFQIYDGSGNTQNEQLPALSPGETHTYSYTWDGSHPVYADSDMIRAWADTSGRWTSREDAGEELEPNEEGNSRENTNNDKKMGYPIDPNVQNPDFIDYNYPRVDTRFGEDLVEEINHNHPESTALYGYYDLWVGYNGFNPEDGNPELRHDNQSYSSTGFPIQTQAEEVDRARTYWNFTNRVNDTYGSMSVFNHSVFVKNPIPEVVNHQPQNDGFESDYPVPVSARAADDNDEEITFYLFNRSDNTLLKKETFSGLEAEDESAETTYQWEVPEAHSEYTLGLVVEDRWDNYTEDIEFMKIIGQGFAMEGGFNYDYTSVILSDSSTRNVLFTAKNTRPFERDINITLSGVNAQFSDGSNYTFTTFDAEEEKEFLLTVNPDENNTGQRYLNVTLDYPDIRYNKTESLPVFVRDMPTVGESKEVPGIGSIQLLMLALLAAYLYSVRL